MGALFRINKNATLPGALNSGALVLGAEAIGVMTNNHQFLLDEALNTVPRVFGLCDREPASRTHGCCDRAYWHYRQTDFANARFQESGLLFAHAFVDTSPGNQFSGKPRLLDWIEAVWSFWLDRRSRDGTVAEAYPNERSFCATAFTAAGFIQTVLLLREARDWTRSLGRVRTTMQWLAKHQNPEVPNQMAGAYLALAGYHALVGSAESQTWAQQKRDAIVALADDDGIFNEYGGFDSGYQSLTMSTLASAHDITGEDEDIAAILDRANATMRDRLTTDKGFEPAANSRQTQYLYPSGLIGDDAFVPETVIPEIERGATLRPSWMDDRYCIALATDYFRAAQRLQELAGTG